MCTLLRKRPMGRTTEDTNSRGNGTALQGVRARVRVRVRVRESRSRGNGTALHVHTAYAMRAARGGAVHTRSGWARVLVGVRVTHHAYDWPMRRGSHGLPSRSSAQSSFTTLITSSSRLAVLDS